MLRLLIRKQIGVRNKCQIDSANAIRFLGFSAEKVNLSEWNEDENVKKHSDWL